MEIPRKKDLTYIAETNFRDVQKKFGIKRNDRRQHMYILGKSGTGKSALLKNMIIQNIANGEGLAVVDPHGELIEDLLEMIPEHRLDDVVYFNPADDDFHMGFNMLEVPDPKYKHLIASGLMGIFTKIWANVWSSRMEYILNNTILALIETPGTTMLAIPRMLVDDDYRNYIISNVTDPVVKSFWQNEFANWQDKFRSEAIAPIQNKVGQFLSTALVRNIVGQQKSTIDIYDIMNSKKILLVNVSKGRIGEDNSALLGAMMITKIQLAAMERVRIPESERKDFYLYVDEFQNFVTESFASILSEARKYRLCLTIAHQYIGQLSMADSVVVRDAVFGNVGSMITFRVGATDAEFIEKEFEPEFMAQDFVNLPNYHIYLKLMIDGVTSRPFSARTLAPFDIEGSDSIRDEIITRARELYARPRTEVEAEISEWSNQKIRPTYDDVPSDPKDAIEGKDGKYRIKCSRFDECGNIAIVPFKPEKGRPVYCKEHIEKIKSEKDNEHDSQHSPEGTKDKPSPQKKPQQVVKKDSSQKTDKATHKESQKKEQSRAPKTKTSQNSAQNSRVSNKTPVKNTPPQKKVAPKTTIKLGDLATKNQKTKERTYEKDAQDNSKNLLRAAIMEATSKKTDTAHKRTDTTPKDNTPTQSAQTSPPQENETEKGNADMSINHTSDTFSQEQKSLQEKIANIEQKLEAQTQATMQNDIESLRRELRELRSQKNEQAHEQMNQRDDHTIKTPPKSTDDSNTIEDTPRPKEVPEDILKRMLE